MKALLLLRLSSLLITLAALCIAFYLQHVLLYSPCALCILQRYVYLVLLFAFLFSLISQWHFFILKIITIPFSLIGIILSAYHIWTLKYPSTVCGPDILESKLNNLIFAHWLPEFFEASGFCFEKNNPLLGLSLPAWSLIGMLVIFCMVLIQFYYSIFQKSFNRR